MNNLSTLLGSVALLATTAKAQPYVPPDRYNEPYKNPIGWFENQGQLIDENGNPRNDIMFCGMRAQGVPWAKLHCLIPDLRAWCHPY